MGSERMTVEMVKMPLTPQESALCRQLEQVENEFHRSAADVIRRMAGEIDALWDRVNHLHRVIRGEYGDPSSIAEGMQRLEQANRARGESP